MISSAPRILPERMRIRGCSTAAITGDALREAAFRAGTDSDACSDTGSGFDFGINTRCDSGLAAAFCKLNLGS